MSTTDPGAVLLTGASGFLGGQLAVELLRMTSKRVFCLVRGRTDAGAETRLHAHLTRLGLATAELVPGRLRVVRGDLGANRLGLTSEDYDLIAESVNGIYHCAASVNLAAGYDRLKSANVAGTQAMIKLVETGNEKILHHVSSLAVFLDARSADLPDVDEQTTPTPRTAGTIGYARTKAEAEAEIARAGIAAVIYRPGLIIADSRNGRSPETDLVVRLMRAAIAVGRAPASTGQVPVSTVDFVARSIVDLSLRDDAIGSAFHPIRPQPFPIRAIFDHARDYGYPLEDLSVADWKRCLAQHRRRPEAFLINAIWPFTSYMLAADQDHTAPVVHSAHTWAALSSTGRPHPPLDATYFQRILDHVTAKWVQPRAGLKGYSQDKAEK